MALDVTRALAGHLICLHVVTAPLDRLEPYSPPEKRPPQPEPVTPTPPEIYPVEPDTD